MRIFAVKFEHILMSLFVCVMLVCLLTTYRQQILKAVYMPTAKKVVVIDAGHGGWDPGMPGQSGENEDKLNLAIAQNLQFYLEQSGSYVVVTRADENATGDTKREDLNERKEITNTSSGDILISIHHNSFPQASVNGAQVFYHNNSEQGKALAECIQNELQGFADSGNGRPPKANTDYYILKNTEIPAAIVECGFLTNPEEEAKLNTEEYQEKIAWSIYMGIIKYFEQTEMA